jgi:hypothetical protein
LLSSLEAEIKRLELDKRRIEQKINYRKDLMVSFPWTGLTGDILPASLEDLNGFEFDFNNFNFENAPLPFKYDRRWTGFPELSEYDFMQGSDVLPIQRRG